MANCEAETASIDEKIAQVPLSATNAHARVARAFFFVRTRVHACACTPALTCERTRMHEHSYGCVHASVYMLAHNIRTSCMRMCTCMSACVYLHKRT